VPAGNVRPGLRPVIDNSDLYRCREVIGDLCHELAPIQINAALPPPKVRLALEQAGLQDCNPATLSPLRQHTGHILPSSEIDLLLVLYAASMTGKRHENVMSSVMTIS
jgi:hypothetical protein